MIVTIGSTSVPFPQQWCEQTQSHHPHIWVTKDGFYASCGGHA